MNAEKLGKKVTIGSLLLNAFNVGGLSAIAFLCVGRGEVEFLVKLVISPVVGAAVFILTFVILLAFELLMEQQVKRISCAFLYISMIGLSLMLSSLARTY